MDLKQLEYFVHVAELGGFTRASEVLGVAQPVLSRQIRLLEVELRQNLLARNGRGAQPTEAGQLLLEHGRGILHQISIAKEELGRVRGSLTGRVAVGLPPSLARVLTVPLTHAFREHLPHAVLAISEGLSTSMQEWLQSGRLDIALLYNAPILKNVEIQPVLDEELFIVEARPAEFAHEEDSLPSSIKLSELAKKDLIIPTRPNAVRMKIEALMSSQGLKPKIGLEIDGVSAILDLVADGAGVAVLSKNAVVNSMRPSAFRLHPLKPAIYVRLSIATSSRRPVTQTQKATIELIRTKLGATG